jgi:hypothetical protein
MGARVVKSCALALALIATAFVFGLFHIGALV